MNIAKIKTIMTNWEYFPEKETNDNLVYKIEDHEYLDDEQGRRMPLYIHISHDGGYATWNRRKIATFFSEEEFLTFCKEQWIDNDPEDDWEEDFLPEDEYPWEEMEKERESWF